MSEREDRSRRYEAEALGQEYHRLDDETQSMVRAVAGECRRTGEMVHRPFRDGEVSAWPHPGGGVSWDVHQPTLDGARGVERLAADYEPVITSMDQLQTLAANWQTIDLQRLSRDPLESKEALAGLQGQMRAALRWADLQDTPERAAEGARYATGLALAAETLRAAIAEASQQPAWKEAFDRAGWPGERRSVLSTIGGLIEGLVEVVTPNQSRDGAGENKPRRGRR